MPATVPVPADYDTVEILAKYISFDAVALQGTVTFTPAIGSLTSPSAAAILLTKPLKGQVVDGVLRNVDNTGPMRLFATDDPDVSPPGWQYSVKEVLDGGAGRPEYRIDVPLSAKAEGLQLWKVAPAPPAPVPGTSYVVLTAFTALESRVKALEAAPAPAAGAGSAYTQTTPAATWTVNHTLGRLPGVDVYVGGVLVEPDVTATTTTVTLTFPAPTSGVAVLT